MSDSTPATAPTGDQDRITTTAASVFGVPRDDESDEQLRADLAAIKEAEQEALRRGR